MHRTPSHNCVQRPGGIWLPEAVSVRLADPGMFIPVVFFLCRFQMPLQQRAGWRKAKSEADILSFDTFIWIDTRDCAADQVLPAHLNTDLWLSVPVWAGLTAWASRSGQGIVGNFPRSSFSGLTRGSSRARTRSVRASCRAATEARVKPGHDDEEGIRPRPVNFDVFALKFGSWRCWRERQSFCLYNCSAVIL
jgi:hypothetical protein